jgi:hypothetical protein
MLRAFEADLAAHRASTRVGCPQNAPVVNVTLTCRCGRQRPPRRHRENGDYGSMVLRMIRAYGRRVAVSDPEDLATMYECLTELAATLRGSIHAGRESDHRGWTWERVGSACGGVSKQAAQARWGRS